MSSIYTFIFFAINKKFIIDISMIIILYSKYFTNLNSSTLCYPFITAIIHAAQHYIVTCEMNSNLTTILNNNICHILRNSNCFCNVDITITVCEPAWVTHTCIEVRAYKCCQGIFCTVYGYTLTITIVSFSDADCKCASAWKRYELLGIAEVTHIVGIHCKHNQTAFKCSRNILA